MKMFGHNEATKIFYYLFRKGMTGKWICGCGYLYMYILKLLVILFLKSYCETWAKKHIPLFATIEIAKQGWF